MIVRDAIATLAIMVFFIGILPILVPLLFIGLLVQYGLFGFFGMLGIIAGVVVVVDHKVTKRGR